MRDLSEIIRKQGGFRFKHTGKTPQSLTYKYNCTQDVAHAQSHQSAAEKQRGGRRMTRFPCQSKLNIRPCLQSRTLSLSIHHKWHPPYEDIQIAPNVHELIHLRVSNKTPSEIHREIRGIPEGRSVTRHQVYHLWQKANCYVVWILWRMLRYGLVWVGMRGMEEHGMIQKQKSDDK